MIKVLVICDVIGRSAAGIVVENLLSYLDSSKKIELVIIANRNFSIKSYQDLRLIGLKRTEINFKYKLRLILTRKEPGSNNWVKMGFQKLGHTKVDAMMAISSAYSFRPFQLAYEISKSKNVPYIIHALDPLPSVKGWGENPLLRFAILRAVKPYYTQSSIISASNKQMVEYQTNLLCLSEHRQTYFYNPILSELRYKSLHGFDPKQSLKLLFLGTLYDKRSPLSLLEAIEKINDLGINVSISFVGHIYSDSIKDLINNCDFAFCFTFQEGPELFVEESHILIDIDADISNDVFISSKLNFYVNIDKPILCITPPRSPTCRFVENCNDSIFVANNNVRSIYDSILYMMNIDKFHYSNRANLRDEISLINVGKKIEDNLDSLIK